MLATATAYGTSAGGGSDPLATLRQKNGEAVGRSRGTLAHASDLKTLSTAIEDGVVFVVLKATIEDLRRH